MLQRRLRFQPCRLLRWGDVTEDMLDVPLNPPELGGTLDGQASIMDFEEKIIAAPLTQEVVPLKFGAAQTTAVGDATAVRMQFNQQQDTDDDDY